MATTTARALALLDLLQRHQHWSGAELAARLDTTERTVRRDITRLRELGYRITSVTGHDGGYRLEAGGSLPPLLLSDDEAVAIAVGLRVAAAEQLIGGVETSLSTIAKLEQVLPPASRRKVNALAQSMTSPGDRDTAHVSTEMLGSVALACRDRERMRFAYVDAHGRGSRRHVEPHALAPERGRWYLVAWDLERKDWRTFRLDRMDQPQRTGARFTARRLTRDEVDEHVLMATGSEPTQIEGYADVEMSMEEFRAHMGIWAEGATTEDPAPTQSQTTRWPLGGDDVRDLFYGLSWLPENAPYAAHLPEQAREDLRRMLERVLDSLVE